MRVLITGTKDWSDYNELIRNLSIVIEDWVKTKPEDKKITFVHTASTPIENMITEYIGKVESFFKQKGYGITEQLFIQPKKSEDKISQKDFQMIESGIDMAVAFNKGKSRRVEHLLDIASEYGIPVFTVDQTK